MNDLMDKLWPAFQAECSEQLEAIELALVGNGGATPDFNDLFRHFHTLKGGCGMMGFGNMGAVAHACEDLLDPVRKGERTLDDPLIDALLAALDCLKEQLAFVEQHRSDPAPATRLLERLHDLQATPAAAGSDAPRAPEMRAAADGFAALAPLLRDWLPELAEASLQPLPLPAALQAPLRHVSQVALASDAGAVAELIGKLMTAPQAESRPHLLADLLERISWCERRYRLDAGTAATAVRLRPVLEDSFRHLAMQLATALKGLDQVADEAGMALANAESLLAALVQQAKLMCLEHTSAVLREALQGLREWRRGGLVAGPGLQELLHVAAGLPAELLEGLEEDIPYVGMCASLLERLQEVIATCARGEGLQQRQAALAARHHLAADLLGQLGGDALDRLEAALERKETLVEVEVDLESARDAGQAFVDCLRATGTLLGNRTVATDARSGAAVTRLSFLAALPLAPADIELALQAVDPPPLHMRISFCQGGEAAPAAVAGGEARVSQQATMLRVESATVDAFVNRVGEMVTLRNMMAHALHRDDIARKAAQVQELLEDNTGRRALGRAEKEEIRELIAGLQGQLEQLAQADSRLQGTLSRLQEEVMALRVVPISLVFNRLPRVVRDLGQALDRQVRLEIRGDDVRIDKAMVDVLVEPLLHLVRNALDHGLESPAERRAAGKPEQASLLVGARQIGNTLLVEVRDDGRGLNLPRIKARALANGLLTAAEAVNLTERELQNLIFLPGFSTAEQVTEVSGRGVGMDAVKTRVLQLGGQVEVSSVAGQGATFTLRLPLSAAIQSVILVAAGGRQLAIPERNVAEVISLPASALQTVQGQACALLRGATLPLYHLAVLLGQRDAIPATGANLEVVVMTDGIYRIGLLVEKVLGRPEVFVRDIHPDLARLPGVGGASVLGDGRVVIILDCENLFDLALRQAQSLRTLLRAS